jgi:hypothetical protein
MNIKTVYDLKAIVESQGSYFFTRKTMRFFGDTMRNFGMRKTKYKDVDCFEVYRKQPVKHNLSGSFYFDCKTLKQIH